MVYEITYDLRNPGRDYSKLTEAIRSLGDWAHPLESVWVVQTHSSSAQIRDHLRQYMDANDGLLVARLSGEAAWMGLNADVGKWLAEKLRAA